jgi:hypothetical protein
MSEGQPAIIASEGGAAGAASAPQAGAGAGQQAGGQDPAPNQQPTGGQQGKGSGDPDLSWTPEQKAYIEGLRKEAAGHRTAKKDLESKYSNLNDRFSQLEGGLKKLFGEDDSLTPEQKAEQLAAHNEQLELKNAISEAAIASGVGGADYEYFEFLIQKEVGTLNEGEELSEERVVEIAQAAKRGTAPNSTTVGNVAVDNPAPENGDGAVTVEAFASMSMSEKSELYQKNKPLYDQLLNQARREGKLIS